MDQYAVVEVAGCQLKVMANTVVRIPKSDAEVGAELSFDKVMLLSDGQKVEIGTPYLEGKAVRAEIIRHGKGEKIRIFKKKRRKTYRKTNGHRQQFTEVRIKEIGGR